MNMLRKKLSETGTQSGTLDIETLEFAFKSFKCDKNLPVYVIPYTDLQIRRDLHKVR